MKGGGFLKRGALGTLSWWLLAGALVMLWFVILSGVRDHTPLNKIWFLQADTSGVRGATHDFSQWTYFHICGRHNEDCDQAKAALPFGYAWYDGDGQGAPSALTGNHGHGTTARYYYYMWRFGWVFYFLAFIFANFAVLTGLLSCLRPVSATTGLLTLVATFWLTLAACLMTAVFTKARDQFKDQGREAKVGPYAFGFTWASLVLLFLSSLLFLGNCLIGRKKRHRDTAGPYQKEQVGPYNPGYGQGNVQSGYTPNTGYGQGNVQSGYAAPNQPSRTTNSDDRGSLPEGAQQRPGRDDDTPTMRGNGRKGLFPHRRQPEV